MRAPCAITVVIALVPAACTQVDPLAPPTVYFGEDVCDICGMIISDERFAAATIVSTPGGHEARLFDDIGCLLEYERGAPDAPAQYVRSVQGDRWLQLAGAHYVYSRELHTPMAFGVAATATADDARTLLAEYPGDILDLAALRERHAAGALGVVPGQDALLSGGPDAPIAPPAPGPRRNP